MVRKLRIENGCRTIVIKNPKMKTDKKLGTLKVHRNVELLLPNTCIAFGSPIHIDEVVLEGQ